MKSGMKKAKRPAGRDTKRVTISLRGADLELMQRLAKRRHGGNLSGAFAEVIRHATRLEAMDRVLAELGVPSPEGLARLEQELAAPLGAPPCRRRSKARPAA
jgi:hypothetical protein